MYINYTKCVKQGSLYESIIQMYESIIQIFFNAIGNLQYLFVHWVYWICSTFSSKSRTLLHFLIIQESNEELYMLALKTLGNLIRASTTSMTSVPKPLKFMKPNYGAMKEIFEKIKQPDVKKECAVIISVLAMTMGNGRECLKYRLLCDLDNIGEWGHEYVR